MEVDESVWSPSDALRIVENKAADIINLKITRVGGLSNAKKIASIAEAADISCLVGTESEFGIGTAAKVHLASSIRTLKHACEFTEFSILEDNILEEPIEIKDGFIESIHGHGLGVKLDEKKVRFYTRKL